MRIVRYAVDGGVEWGRADEAGAVVVLSDAPWSGGAPTGARRRLEGLRLLAPCAPGKIVCVGRNYAAHAKELGNELPPEPLLFLKPPSAVIGPEEAIRLPPESDDVQHEAELAVVIGRRSKGLRPEEVPAAVAGFVCANDLTARDIQRRETHLTRSKSFDTFCPVGPWVREGWSDPAGRFVRCRVDGELRQNGDTGEMIVGVAELVAYISRIMTLEPGDLILTGTPAGVGSLRAGMRVEVEIEGVGTLGNPVRA